jgi:hypothetical protein
MKNPTGVYIGRVPVDWQTKPFECFAYGKTMKDKIQEVLVMLNSERWKRDLAPLPKLPKKSLILPAYYRKK